MKFTIAVALVLATTLAAQAGTDCTTRKSGGTTITSCSSTKNSPATTCRSYKSVSTLKTHCR